MPWVSRVSDHVDQWITEFIDHPFVKFRTFTVDFENNILARQIGDIPDHAFEASEQRPHRNHPGIHHGFLDAVSHSLKLMHGIGQIVDQRSGPAKIGQACIHMAQIHSQTTHLILQCLQINRDDPVVLPRLQGLC